MFTETLLSRELEQSYTEDSILRGMLQHSSCLEAADCVDA